MKKQLLLLLLLVFLLLLVKKSFAQTRILDSQFSWSNYSLTVFLSDTLVSAIDVSLGTALDSTDIFNQTWLVPAQVVAANDMVSVPIANVSTRPVLSESQAYAQR